MRQMGSAVWSSTFTRSAKCLSLTGRPKQSIGFRFLDPRRFLIAVGMGIIGMKFARATFFDFISDGHFRMGAQIISECEMPFYMRRISLEKVKLRDANAAQRFRQTRELDLHFAQLNAAQRGARTIEMTVVNVRDALISWYERRGYRKTGETRPFPYGDNRYGTPTRSDLEFVVLARHLHE